MTWRFSDGTTVDLGGKVEGSSFFAQSVRAELANPPVLVSIWPHPSPDVDVDLQDVALVDAWLRHRVSRPSDAWMLVELTDAPSDIPPLPEPPKGDDVPADAIY